MPADNTDPKPGDTAEELLRKILLVLKQILAK